MTLFIRQLRTLISEAPIKQKKTEPVETRRKSLCVKISKEPPAIVYFEKDTLEDSFECIFDPKVHHDKEEDHPDLAIERVRKRVDDLKPWQRPPYCNQKPNFMTRFKSTFSF